MNKDRTIYSLQKDIARVLGFSVSKMTKILKKHKITGTKINRSILYRPREVRSLITSLGYKYPALIISFLNLKGGVGKTSLCINLAYALASLGCRVLLIDLDVQGNASTVCRSLDETDELPPTWLDIVEGKFTVKELIIKVRESFDIITCNLNMSTLDRSIGNQNIATLVSSHLKDIKNSYDIILIDTHPELSNLNLATVIASDTVYLPTKADLYSFNGLIKMFDELDFIRKQYDHYFKENQTQKVIVNMFKETRNSELTYLLKLNEAFTGYVGNTVFKDSADMATSCSKQLFAMEYKRNSLISKQIIQWAIEILSFQEQEVKNTIRPDSNNNKGEVYA